MRTRLLILAIVALTAHLGLAADEQQPPEVKINPANVAPGISPETLADAAAAIRAYGIAWDTGDEAKYREALSGTPELIDLSVAFMKKEQLDNEINRLAREKAGLPPGTTQPSTPGPHYNRTDYHRRVLEEPVEVKGDNQRITIHRSSRPEPNYIVEKTAEGWRVVVDESELGGVPIATAREIVELEHAGYELIRDRLNKGEFKSWQEYSDAKSIVRKQARDAMRASAEKKPS